MDCSEFISAKTGETRTINFYVAHIFGKCKLRLIFSITKDENGVYYDAKVKTGGRYYSANTMDKLPTSRYVAKFEGATSNGIIINVNIGYVKEMAGFSAKVKMKHIKTWYCHCH